MMEINNAYLDKVEERHFSIAREKKALGAKIVGIYCAFTPKEIIAAAGAIPVALCSGSNESIPKAEEHLPRNLCPLVKASYGSAITERCPYFFMADILVADATCDGKKKMYELMSRVKEVHLLNLPQIANLKGSFDLWLSELHRFKGFLEKETDSLVSDEKLWESIKLYNRVRELKRTIFELNRGPIPLLSGRELSIAVDSGGFEVDLPGDIDRYLQVIDFAKQRGGIKPRPRILLTGCPTTSEKVLHCLEEYANVVAMENCGGLKSIVELVDETGNPMAAIARSSLRLACPCMSPNELRYQLIASIIEDYSIDGVVDLIWQACHTYNIESYSLGDFVRREKGVPFLQIETDYSDSDINWINLRIEAFIEML
ncbi:hypothetical protein ASZ90_017429 [hydrocarbon metagenome]|uniref:2-hydroxyglutaryl-coa dehydratase, d-component n=1 Tax=hydrocarbon metagenome TaxID=938273 RepID=A0A0W8E906_9ZZZZ